MEAHKKSQDAAVIDENFKLCTSKGLSATHSTTLATFINLFHNQLHDRKGQAIKSREELASTVSNSLRFFDDVVVREEIYKLNLQRI